MAAALLVSLLVPGVAGAEWNSTPIAVPLIGTSGTGSPYPSRITVMPPGGPTMYGHVSITLHRVTHPCPDDLGVLLVHGTDKFLLLSNAGGCRPLQGTDITFSSGAPALPDTETTGTPYDTALLTNVSNYGAQPTFPAPAPAGPYDTNVPPDFLTMQGAWDLYVVDLHGANRGVIAGGWSIVYSQYFGHVTTSALPVAIPDVSPAATYPVIFDFSQAAPDAVVRSTNLFLWLSHPYADDVRVVLQSPAGTAVVVMSNAGGSSPLSSTQELEFRDSAPSYMPDTGPIDVGSIVNYKPGSAYGGPTPSLPSPAPPAPYATAFAAFVGQPVRGIWRLWIYDDEAPDAGSLTNASLAFSTDIGRPAYSLIVPETDPTTATQPFVQLFGQVDNVDRPMSAFWRVESNGAFYDAGSMEVLPAASGSPTAYVRAHVPVQKGTNLVRTRIIDNGGFPVDRSVTINVNEFTYSLSEGATGGFFDEDVTLGNPTDAAAPVRVDFLQEGAPPVAHPDAVAANAPLQLHVDDLVPPGAVSTIVHSLNAVPLAVERTMSWDSTGYGGSGGTAISPNLDWLFAEGSQGYFDTYLLLANDNDVDAHATVHFLREGGGLVNHPVTVQAHKRLTIYTGDIPELVNTSFGMEITADTPITAERAMYFPHGSPRVFEGGHEAAGVNDISKHWYLAEGATGPFFECFVLLSNPALATAHATLTYLLPNGTTIAQTVDVPANGRTTVNVETVDPRLANTPVSTIVTSDLGIIVERSMYWPDASLGWREAHNSPGVVDPALRWGVSDVRVGGTRDYQTYILLANPNPVEAEVQVRLLRPGAAPLTQSYTLPPTSRTNVVAADLAGAVAGTYSADVQVLNYQAIVVEKAMYWNSGSEIWAAGTGVVATPLPPR
jgi:subtilisin-like proprotein convertase family protein